MRRAALFLVIMPVLAGILASLAFVAWRMASPDIVLAMADGPWDFVRMAFGGAASAFLAVGIVALIVFVLAAGSRGPARSLLSFLLRMTIALALGWLCYVLYGFAIGGEPVALRFAAFAAALPPFGLVVALLTWPLRRLVGLDGV